MTAKIIINNWYTIDGNSRNMYGLLKIKSSNKQNKTNYHN